MAFHIHKIIQTEAVLRVSQNGIIHKEHEKRIKDMHGF